MDKRGRHGVDDSAPPQARGRGFNQHRCESARSAQARPGQFVKAGNLIDNHAVRITRVNGWPTYLVKGGTPDVWRQYKVKRKWRKSQGVIFGKRCGTTENIGPKARER